MRPRINALTLLSALLLAGCADRPQLTAPADTPNALIAMEPVRDGTTSDFSFSTTVVYESTDSWMNRPEVDVAYSYSEYHNWNSTNQFWNVTYDIASTQSPLGSNYPPSDDIAQAYLRYGSMELRNRAGSVVAFPTTTLVSEAQVKTTDMVSRAPSYSVSGLGSVTPRLSRASTSASTTPNGPGLPPEARSAAVDRMVITPEGTGRTLKRLRDTFAEETRSDGTFVFTETRGSTSVRIVFDPSLGAIVRTDVLDNGRLASRIDRKYQRDQGFTVLLAETTTLYDPQGKVANSWTENYNIIETR